MGDMVMNQRTLCRGQIDISINPYIIDAIFAFSVVDNVLDT